jgi:glycosyltransferase involved in cell wall biosynthesis
MKKEKKHIALFLPSLRGGGAEKMMINLAKGFIDNNIKVDFITVENDNVYKIPDKVNYFCLNLKKVKYGVLPLAKYLKKEKPDYLISTLIDCDIVSLLAKMIYLSKTKIIVRSASTFSFLLKTIKKRGGITQKYGAMILYRLAYQIVANSKQSADDLAKTLKIPRKKIKVIYNPTVTPDISTKMKVKINHPWFNNKNSPIILAVGRLNKAKNFPLLIKTIKIIRKKIDVKLIILGEGSERNNLKNLIIKLNLEKYIDMPGFIDNPYSYMSKADVYVLSSSWEGLPNVLIETMACGTPVVSTNCPSGPSEILEGGKYGKLVPVNDPEALAEAIIETLNNPVDSSELEKRANFFSVENSVNKYLEIIKNEKHK